MGHTLEYEYGSEVSRHNFPSISLYICVFKFIVQTDVEKDTRFLMTAYNELKSINDK